MVLEPWPESMVPLVIYQVQAVPPVSETEALWLPELAQTGPAAVIVQPEGGSVMVTVSLSEHRPQVLDTSIPKATWPEVPAVLVMVLEPWTESMVPLVIHQVQAVPPVSETEALWL